MDGTYACQVETDGEVVWIVRSTETQQVLAISKNLSEAVAQAYGEE